MASADLASELELDEEWDLYEIANLYPRDTGLPLTVWINPKGRTRHDARVKVCVIPGDRMDADQTATVTVRPEPRLLHGELASSDLAAVQRWIGLNAEVLIDYWDGRASTLEMAKRLRPV